MDPTRALAFDLRPAVTAEELAHARTLFREYASGLGFALDFQGFEDELARLPGEYAAPRGVILLAWPPGTGGAGSGDAGAREAGAEPLGCVALRPLEDEGACEMKRMFVRPAGRGKGLGRVLGNAILEEARARSYRAMRLDTIDSMDEAIALYRSLGFREIPPYRYNPIAGALYFEAEL